MDPSSGPGESSPILGRLVIGDARADRGSEAGPMTRRAVKAVCMIDGGLLMLHSAVTGDLKFPGGGIRAHESPAQALARELDEECGRDLGHVGPLLLTTVERRPDATDPTGTFQMISDYRWCAVSDQVRPQRLEDYERDLQMRQVVVDPSAALAANRGLATADAPVWIRREVLVLERLLGIG